MADFVKYLLIDSVDEESDPGKYLKREQVLEVRDSEGDPWEPVPGPDPWDDLVVADKATWSDGNVYAVGEDIAGVSATYVGGTDQVIYRSRAQHKPAGENNWTNGTWTNHPNTLQAISFTIPAGEENGEIRFQTQARDNGTDPALQVNSNTVIKKIAPLEWGVITQTIEDSAYDPNVDGSYPVSVNTPFICAVSVANAPSDISYEWTRRGQDNVLIGTPTSAQTAITFPEQGIFTITVSIRSGKTAEWTSAIFTFLAS